MPSAGASLESIAPDAHFITFPVTDGHSSRWPESTRPPPPSAREVNWFRKMAIDERYACRWRNLIGQGIAKLLDKPDKAKYCLRSFPEGYWIFDHNKGSLSNIRHDLYLYGSKNLRRFRSPAEFIPHGYWLLTDPTLNIKNCGCKYCGGGGKKTQTEISEALGLPTNRGPTAVTGTTRIRNGETKQISRFSGRVSNAVTSVGPWTPKERRSSPKMDPEWRVTSLGLNLVANSSRTSDLRLDRVFRMGELVWCRWHAGTPQRAEEFNLDGHLWPAIVIDYGLDISVDRSLRLGSESIAQKRTYVLRCLGTRSWDRTEEYECSLAEEDILPWHAHKADLSFVLSSVSKPNGPDTDFHAFAFALSTAEYLVRFWAVCDRLPTKIPLPEAGASKTGDSSHDTFSHTPTMVSLNDTMDSTPISSIPYSVESTPPRRTSARLAPPSTSRAKIANNSVTVRIPASLSSNKPSIHSQRIHELRDLRSPVVTVIETRYQGLWYGAERIWTGDLVRLTPERQAFSRSLQLSSEEYGGIEWQQNIIPSPGAEMRGVLMRIDKIFARIGEKGTKECAVSGPLYEIAPTDWKTTVERSANSVATSLQPSLPPGSREPTYPWNMIERRPPSRDRPATRQEHFVDMPVIMSPAKSSGYALRPLLPAGFEISVPVSFIAGRYYPNILESSLLNSVRAKIPKAVRSLNEIYSVDRRSVELLSLCALAPGRYNYAECVAVRLASRPRMLREAMQMAKGEQGEKDADSPLQGLAMDLG